MELVNMPTLNNTFNLKNKPKVRRRIPRFDPRKNSRERGYNYRWEKARLLFLKRNPICVEHANRDETVIATVVDHIKPHRGDMEVFWDSTNWQSLCEECHNTKSAAENVHGFGASPRPKWLKKSRIPVTMVTGAPLSGKSTWVAQRSTKRSLVIDLDEIMSEMTGKPVHTFDKDPILGEAIYKRNSLLGKLSSKNIHLEYDDCYFILGAPDSTTRRWWADKLGCEVVIMGTSVDKCLERLQDSDRYGKKTTENVIKKHFMRYNRCINDQIVN